MKRTATFRLFLLTALLISLSLLSKAQSKTLPYYSGFDGDFVDEGWTPFQLKSTLYSNWGISKNGAPSPPNFITHDYPVGNSNNDIVEDWYVSPPLKVTGKSLVSLTANVYTIGQRQSTDYFGVWYSTKSRDPKSGDYKELADLTSFATNKFTNWHDTAGILLKDSGAAVYIAFKYRETTNWFTVGVDNVRVKAVHNSGIKDEIWPVDAIKLYPNPSNGTFTLQLPAALANGASKIEVFDLTGKQLISAKSTGLTEVSLATSLANGIYMYKVTGNDGRFCSGKFIVQ
jgi:hypothetical protein